MSQSRTSNSPSRRPTQPARLAHVVALYFSSSFTLFFVGFVATDWECRYLGRLLASNDNGTARSTRSSSSCEETNSDRQRWASNEYFHLVRVVGAVARASVPLLCLCVYAGVLLPEWVHRLSLSNLASLFRGRSSSSAASSVSRVEVRGRPNYLLHGVIVLFWFAFAVQALVAAAYSSD